MAQNNVLFTVGTEDKMDMSLDAIIKTQKKGKDKKPKGKNVRQGPPKQSVTQRKKELANNATRRAASIRTRKIEKMRGIESTAPQANKPKKSFGGGNSVRNVRRPTSTTTGDWLKQQRLRQQQQRKKMQQYKQKQGGSNSGGFKISFGTNNSNRNQSNVTKSNDNGPRLEISFDANTRTKKFHFNAPNSEGDTNRQSRRPPMVRKGKEERRPRVTERPIKQQNNNNGNNRRSEFQSRQSRTVTERRGIQTTTTSTSSGSTLNEIFGQASSKASIKSNRSVRGGSSRGTSRGNTRGNSRGGNLGRRSF